MEPRWPQPVRAVEARRAWMSAGFVSAPLLDPRSPRSHQAVLSPRRGRTVRLLPPRTRGVHVPDRHELEARLRIKFKDPHLLRQALIHTSYLNENPGIGIGSNERLE